MQQPNHSANSKIDDLSIIIPAFNEASRIQPTLLDLKKYLSETAQNYEVIIVDDGSTDHTVEASQKAILDWPQARIIRLSKNQKKGGAIREGILAATKQNVVFMDADCSTDLTMLSRLFSVLSTECPVVIGSRDIQGAEVTVSQHILRELSAKLFNLWVQFWILPGIWDTQCGFKMFKSNVAKKLFQDLKEYGFGFDIEILYRAKQRGLKIKEMPVRWKDSPNSRVRPLRDGLSMAFQAVWLRFSKT